MSRRQPENSRRWGRRAADAPPLVLGHRGASAHATENTLAAFRRAREDGADGVELDVIRCRTGEIVVFHDDDLSRLAGRPDAVRDLPLAALRDVRLTPGGEIPTLSEVIEELGPDMLINIELKARNRSWAGQRLAPAVAALIRRHGLEERALVSSFHPLALARFRLAAPHVATGLLFAADQSWPLRNAWSRVAIRPAGVHPERVLCTRERVAAWHRAGYFVNVWTVDDPAELRHLDGLGVDGVIANDPANAIAALKQS